MNEEEFVPQSEAQMCFEEANIARVKLSQQEGRKIQQALDAGKFVVVDEHPHYCKATDAVTGTVRYFHSAHDTREEANQEAQRASNPETGDPESSIHVLPALPNPQPPVPEAESGTEDVPF